MTDPVLATRTQGYCGLCIARCGTVATVEDGRFIRLDPDPTHSTGQAICAKGRAAPELVYSPQRLTHPLRRTRPKGDPDPGWERISWEEALGTIATEMRGIAERHGPDAMGFTWASPSTTPMGEAAGFIRRLMNAFGTPNGGTSLDVCGWGRYYASSFTYGIGSLATSAGGGMPDIAKSGCLVLWGYNPSISRLTHATATAEALQRGMKLIVVDPRQAGLANKADVWLRVRPGSDGALALGLAHLMIARGWYDRDFVRDWSNGPLLVRADTGRLLSGEDGTGCFAWDTRLGRAVPFDPATGRYEGETADLALEGGFRVATGEGEVLCHPSFGLYAELCARYTPDVVAATCWVGEAELEAAARLLWEARPVSYYAWSGHEQHANATQTARAISLLYALTGNFDAPGGNVLLPAPASAAITGGNLAGAKKMPAPVGVDQRPLGPASVGNVTSGDMYRAILEREPYPLRGLMVFGANLLVAQVGTERARAALTALDFYVCADLFMTPTAELADIVLPVASCFETEGLKIGFEVSEAAQAHVQLRPAVVPARGEARSDNRIIFDIAAHLGLGAAFWDGDIDAAYRTQLGPTGVTLEALRAAPGGLAVPLQTRHRKYAAPGPDGVPRGFATPSRKVEFYSERLLAHGYAPLPDFVEPPIGPVSRPDLVERYPLVLTCAKPALFCQSQHRALPSLRKRQPHPQVTLHPTAARARGIGNGDWVSVETPEGAIRVRARLSADIDPRVAVGEHGWWQASPETGAPGYDPFGPDGANFNRLISHKLVDPVSGTPSLRANLCEIRR